MSLLRKFLAYLIPIFTVVGTGAINPIPTDSPWHNVVPVVAGALATWLSLRIHPYGVNGPAQNAPPDVTLKSPSPIGIGLLFLVLAFCFFRPLVVHAQDNTTPTFGGCNSIQTVCWGPQSALSLTSVNLRTGVVSPNLNLGLGYGLTFYRGRSFEFGVSPYVNFSPGDKNHLQYSILASFMNWLRIGFSRNLSDDNYLTIGLGAGL